MIDALLRDLIERKITSVKELSRLTGRGTSTIYRWVNGETQPDIHEVCGLIRDLAEPEARHALVEMFAEGLPVRIEWLEPNDTAGGGPLPDNRHDATDLALLTVECLAKVLLNQRETMKRGELTPAAQAEIGELLNTAINHLVLARRVVAEMPTARRRAAKPRRGGG